MRDVARDQAKSQFVQNKHQHINGRVLDAGCGNMPYKRVFWNPEDKEWRDGVTEWVGVDVRPVGDHQADLANLECFEDAQFDTVLCTDVLHEVIFPHLAVAEMWRVLKPGGFLLIAALNTWPDDGKTLWTISEIGLVTLIRTVCGAEPLEGAVSGSVTKQDRDSYQYQTKYSMPFSDSLVGMLDAIDDKYPLMSFVIVQKENTDDSSQPDNS